MRCNSSNGKDHVNYHPIPTRRDVEIATFFWALRCEAVRNPDLPFPKILREIYKELPFVYHFSEEKYVRIFREAMDNFIRNYTSVDRKKAKLRAEIVIRLTSFCNVPKGVERRGVDSGTEQFLEILVSNGDRNASSSMYVFKKPNDDFEFVGVRLGGFEGIPATCIR